MVVGEERSALCEEAVKAHCKQHLAIYKVPREGHFQSVPLPRNATGKVDRGKFLKSARGKA